MEQERAIRRDREAAGTPGSAYSSTQYTRSGVDAMGAGGGAPRSAMGKYYPGMMSGAAPSMRRPLVMDSDGYARRSEPSLSKGDIARFEAKSEAMDVHGDLLRLRRSMPSASHNRMAEDLAWAHESIKQSEHRSTSASSSSSGSSTAPMGILARGLTVHSSDASSGKPSAYQLQRARTADVVQRTDGQGQGDVSMLRQQVTLLRRSLEEEKKRRVMEQKLMQDKIIELQGLIRHNMPEQKRELERNLNAMRTPSGKQSVQALQRQQLQQQQQQLASQQQQAVASGVPSHMRAMRNCKQLQQAQERSPYKTMKLLSEVGPEQLDLDDGTDEEVGDVEEDCEDEADEDEDEDEDEDDIDEEEVPRIDNLDLSETKERRKSDGASSTHSNNDDDRQSAAVRAVETRMAQELTKLRARMRAVVLEAQNEVNTLKQRLDDDHKIHERKERQLRMESSLRVTSLEERHNYAKKKLLGKTSLLSTQVAMLTDENQKLLQEVKVKDERIRQLELALGGRRIVLDSTKPHQQKSNPQQQS